MNIVWNLVFGIWYFTQVGKKKIVQKGELQEEKSVIRAPKKDVVVKSKNRISEGRIYISSSYNNTIITLTDIAGQVIASKSAGAVGFKGTKKSTSFAASKVAEVIAAVCKKMEVGKIEVLIKGIGAGRASAIRTLVTHGLNIISIEDVTPIPHNGGRPPKLRRV